MQNPEYYWNYESALDKFYIAQIHLFRKRTICSAGGLPEAKKQIERAGALKSTSCAVAKLCLAGRQQK
jgi:hypothetical protein